MKKIKLPDGTEFVPFDGYGGVGFLVSAAEFPSEDLLTERMEHDWALGSGLLDAVRQGRLRVRDFCTKLPLKPDAPGSQVLPSLVSVNDLREFVAELGCAVQVDDVPDGSAKENQEQRQARRYQMCIDDGLDMPVNDFAHLPRGIGKLAKREGITRPAFTEDVKKHINRLAGR